MKKETIVLSKDKKIAESELGERKSSEVFIHVGT